MSGVCATLARESTGRGRHHPRGGLRHAAPAAADVGADPSIGDDAEGHGEASWKTGHPQLGI